MLTERRRFSALAALFCFCVSLVTAGMLISWGQGADFLETLMLVLLGLASILPFGIRLLQRRVDVFEPVYAFSLSTLIYFVVVPVVLLPENSFYLGGINYRPELGLVVALAFVALLGFYLGYYGFTRRTQKRRLAGGRVLGDPALHRLFWRWAVGVSALSLGLVVLWLVIADVPLPSLWVLGEASYGEFFAAATGPQVGYLYGARDALPACLILLIASRPGRNWLPILIALLLIVGLFFAGIGVRFRVLVLVVAVFMFYFLERQKRPRLFAIVAAGIVLFYYVVGALGFYRGVEVTAFGVRDRALGADEFTVAQARDTFLEGSQIVTSTAVLVRMVPKHIDYLWGLSFLGVFTQPIPRFIWPDKPTTFGLADLAPFWRTGTAAAFWALFYVNFGPAGILVGMLVWGFLSRWIYEAYRLDPHNPLAQAQLAVYYPYIFHMYGRGATTFAFILYGLVVVLLPVWLVWWRVKKFSGTQLLHEEQGIAQT